MAITSFAVSAGIVSGGVYIYHNKENIKEQIQQEVVDSVSEMIPDLCHPLLVILELVVNSPHQLCPAQDPLV